MFQWTVISFSPGEVHPIGLWGKLFLDHPVYITGYSGQGPKWELSITLVLPLIILQMIILTNSDKVPLLVVSVCVNIAGSCLFLLFMKKKTLFKSLPYFRGRGVFRLLLFMYFSSQAKTNPPLRRAPFFSHSYFIASQC